MASHQRGRHLRAARSGDSGTMPGSAAAESERVRWTALRTVGTRLAVAAAVRTGRRRVSETSATITGAAAAPRSVPEPQIRATAYDAAADAKLAMISVCSEMPLRAWRFSRPTPEGDVSTAQPIRVRCRARDRGLTLPLAVRTGRSLRSPGRSRESRSGWQGGRDDATSVRPMFVMSRSASRLADLRLQVAQRELLGEKPALPDELLPIGESDRPIPVDRTHQHRKRGH
jgi:hypothetical protein